MNFINTNEFRHSAPDKIGVLVTNLGTPAAPTRRALRPYLKQFLSDPRVVEVPKLLWWFVLNVIILTFRPGRSAKAYATVWTEEGSPLMTFTKRQTAAIRARLSGHSDVVVEFAMRYGEPSIASILQKMADHGVRKLLVLPLYPQYSASTTASTFDAIAEDFTQRRWLPDLRFVSHYHDRPSYIEAVANKVKDHWTLHDRADKLVFSFHGIPQRYLDNGDPYHCECHKTARLVAEYLGLSADQYLVVFQSRFGREPWLQPYCDETMKRLPSEGVKSVQIICPGFSSDCLETIEEIAIENHDFFMAAGGERFEYIPALNDDEEHIGMLVELIEENLHGWESKVDAGRIGRAKALGARS